MHIGLFLCDVADESGEEFALTDIRLSDLEFHRNRVAIGKARFHDTADADDLALAGRQIVADVLVMMGLIGIGHEAFDVLAHDIFGFVTEQGFCRTAEGHDDSAIIDHDHRVRYRLQNRRQD